MEVTMEIKVKTEIGEMTAVIVSDILDNHQTAYTAWLKEYPGAVTQDETISGAINKLHTALEMLLEVEIQMLMED